MTGIAAGPPQCFSPAPHPLALGPPVPIVAVQPDGDLVLVAAAAHATPHAPAAAGAPQPAAPGLAAARRLCGLSATPFSLSAGLGAAGLAFAATFLSCIHTAIGTGSSAVFAGILGAIIGLIVGLAAHAALTLPTAPHAGTPAPSRPQPPIYAVEVAARAEVPDAAEAP